MGIRIPTYIKDTSGDQLSNVYMSLRSETIIFQQKPDGRTYNVSGSIKVYQNPTDIYIQDVTAYNINLTRNDINVPLHTIIYNNIKTKYPGSTDEN